MSEIAYQECATVTLDQLKAYAEASGDHNPIHQDEAAAKKSGLPGVIAHGMWGAGVLAEFARKWLERNAGPSFQFVSMQTRFRGMMLLGDRLSAGGSVSKTENTHTLELALKNAKDEVVLTSQIVAKAKA